MVTIPPSIFVSVECVILAFFTKSSCVNPCFSRIRLMFSDIAVIICDDDRNKRIIFSPGPDKIAYTIDDITLPYHPNVIKF